VKRFDIYALASIFGFSIVLASLLVYATAYKSPAPTVATATPSPTASTTYATSASVTIPHADRFEPLVLEAAAGATVTWNNQDSDAHTVVAMPTDPVDFKLTMAPGASASFTFKQAGVYGYYCDVHSMYDPATGLIKADKGADAYPVSMYGVLVVVDPSLPVWSGHAKVVVPGADRFQPLATVVRAGTTLEWTNIDTDAHSVVSPPGVSKTLNLLVQPRGQSSEFMFPTTGVYTYYCNLHAKWNADLQRAQALPGSSEYPAAMEGVIFVLP